MAKKSNPREKTVTPRPIESLIHVIRGQKVMVDADLADLYGVPTGALNQAVRRNDRTASVIEVLVEDIDRLAREVKDMKALPPVTKRRIGFIIDDE